MIDVGCGIAPHPDATMTVDYEGAIVNHDLSIFPWPFKDNEFDHVRSRHFMEHVDDYIKTFDEMYRICKPDGILEVIVPYWSSYVAHHPEHKLFYNYNSFDFFALNVIDYKRMSKRGKARVEILKRHHHMHPKEVKTKYTKWEKILFYPIEVFADKYPLFYQRFLANIIPAYEIQFVMKAIKRG